jgi:hypothetical protein
MKRALVLSLICVLGLAFTGLAATLSGSWDTDVTIDPTIPSFADALTLVSVITVAYTVGDWTFTSVTDLADTGWTDQDFSVAGVLGAFTLTSALDFSPAGPTPSFGSWTTTADISIAGVTIGMDFTLAGGSVDLDVSVAGVAGDVGVGAIISFGAPGAPCDLNWQGIVIALDFPFCCADVSAEIAFDCTGFDSITFSVGGIAVPNVPWLTVGADLTFDLVEGKELLFTVDTDFGDFGCFTLDIDLVTTDPILPNAGISVLGFEINGIGLTCDIGAVTFTANTWFAGDHDYFEVYTISTNDDACCGPFSFDLSISFDEGGVALFDVALIEAAMELQVATQFTFNMGLNIDVNIGTFTQWVVGFLVSW